jgi:hypothetical protein
VTSECHETPAEFQFGKTLFDHFTQAIFVPKHLARYLMPEVVFPTDPQLEKMLADLKNKGISNEKVLEVFTIVDRKFFMQ